MDSSPNDSCCPQGQTADINVRNRGLGLRIYPNFLSFLITSFVYLLSLLYLLFIWEINKKVTPWFFSWYLGFLSLRIAIVSRIAALWFFTRAAHLWYQIDKLHNKSGFEVGKSSAQSKPTDLPMYSKNSVTSLPTLSSNYITSSLAPSTGVYPGETLNGNNYFS